jgi:hypothetical protein
MSTKTNLILDLTIFTTFLVVSNPRLTGNSIHEWLAVSFAAAIITHLLFHWKWIVNLSATFFKKLFHQSRLNFMVDALFFIAMTGAIFSGLMISKDVLSTLGIQLGNVSRNWKSLHSLTADTSLILLGLHFALHWNWVVSNVGRYLVTPVRDLFRGSSETSPRQRPMPQPKSLTVQPVRIDEGK